MTKSLKGKKCFITGAASGIGRATALAAASEGAKLFLTDIQAAPLEAVVENARRLGAEVPAYRALDISDFEAVAAFAGEIHASYGSMDVVMNIAGIAIWGTVETMEHRHWKSVIDVNLMGPIHVIESFIPPMIAGGRGGHLVNVSSAAGLFGLPWHAAYSASKFGLRGISEVLRFDLRRHGIAVVLVCPGAVNTPIVSAVRIVGIDETRKDVQRMKAHFQKRAVTPEHAAQAILRGIQDDRYMVFTSRDIAVGYWLMGKFALPYERLMRSMNDRFHRLATRAPARSAGESRASAQNGGRA
ncbi:MAG: SDR family oxidoreductase [Polyangiaceae bacterium]